jgi:hypothetical protein
VNLGGRINELKASFDDCLAKARAYEGYEPDDSVDQETYNENASQLTIELRKSALQLINDAQRLIERIDGEG